MTSSLKALAAACVLVGVFHASVARAAGSESDGASANASPTIPISEDAGRGEPPLPPRFAVAGTDRSVGPRDTGEAAESTPIGPQYTISRRLTLGGVLEHPDVSHLAANDLGANPQSGRYVFALRIAF